MRRYARLFLLFARQSFAADVANALDFWTYVAGKLIRIVLFFAAIVSIFQLTPTLAGYSLSATLLIFATYNIVDLITQLFFLRGMHVLQQAVRLGRFDVLLTRPVSPLFSTAFGIIDYMDLVTLVPVFGILWWAVAHISVAISLTQILLYLLLIANGVFIIFSIATIVSSFTFWTYELEHTWWLYRFTFQAMRYPVEIFRQPLRFILTWVIPLGIIVTFPARAFLGILSWQFAVGAFIFSIVFFYCALSFWRYAIRQYSSASS